ncbi:MAG TPA: PPC domain-containing protein, partial [Thermoanaerobaculia bacterium]|nr:PPC domain-containing protein [Thermoanaerobaculia bacterium]
VAGALDPGRVQELTFAAAAGRGYVVRATGMGDFDSQLTLLDAEGGTLAENDDFGAGRDARIDWLAPADGTYRIQLREYGDRGGEYTVSLLELPEAVSIAAAGERASATPVEVGVEVAGSLPSGAPQWLRFAARAGHAYRIEASALPLDTRLWLYSEAAGGDLLAMNDDREAEDWEPRIDWLSEEDTAVYLQLDERDGTPGAFRLSVREIEPSDALREAAARRPFDGHAVGDRVRLGRHRPIDGVDNWDPGMEPWVGQAATIEELVGQESDTGAWVVRVDVDGGEWVWRTADLRPADGD